MRIKEDVLNRFRQTSNVYFNKKSNLEVEALKMQSLLLNKRHKELAKETIARKERFDLMGANSQLLNMKQQRELSQPSELKNIDSNYVAKNNTPFLKEKGRIVRSIKEIHSSYGDREPDASSTMQVSKVFRLKSKNQNFEKPRLGTKTIDPVDREISDIIQREINKELMDQKILPCVTSVKSGHSEPSVFHRLESKKVNRDPNNEIELESFIERQFVSVYNDNAEFLKKTSSVISIPQNWTSSTIDLNSNRDCMFLQTPKQLLISQSQTSLEKLTKGKKSNRENSKEVSEVKQNIEFLKSPESSVEVLQSVPGSNFVFKRDRHNRMAFNPTSLQELLDN